MIPKVKRSGGPKSKSGKKVVSKNATKTGVYSRSIVLPNEDKSAYQQLVSRYMTEFNPSDMAETTMVNNLANLTWKKMRLDQYEQNSLMAEWDKGVMLSELKDEKLMHFPRDLLWLEIYVLLGPYLNKSLDDLEREYVQYETDISELYSQEVNVHYLERFFYKNTELLKEISAVAKDKFNRKHIEVADLLKDTTYIGEEDVAILDACTDKILEYRKDIAWYRDNEEQIEEAKLQLKEKRLMAKMQQTDFTRAHDELDRSFYRTLTELRKQQQWRREQNEVVVIAENQK